MRPRVEFKQLAATTSRATVCKKSERTFPNLLALPAQTTPGRVTVTRCRSALCPWPENENLPLLLNAIYSPRGHIYGLPNYRQYARNRRVPHPRISLSAV